MIKIKVKTGKILHEAGRINTFGLWENQQKRLAKKAKKQIKQLPKGRK